MRSVTVSAPGKLMLLGDHAVVYHNPCLVTAVDQRMHATVTLLEEPVFTLEAPDVGITNYQKPMTQLGHGDVPKGARFVEAAIHNMFELRMKNDELGNVGVAVETKSEFSSEFGFGSSSSSTVCVVKALSELLDLHLSNKELFDVAYKTVIDVQGVGSGFDIAAGIYGETLYFIGGGQRIEPIKIRELPLVVGYSGVKGDTAALVQMVAAQKQADPARFESLFAQSNKLVEAGRGALEVQDFKGLGRLFEAGERLMADYGVETEKLKIMVDAAVAAGAWGAKMSGAGGGDCMIALVPQSEKEAVEQALEKAGGTIVTVQTNAPGVRVQG